MARFIMFATLLGLPSLVAGQVFDEQFELWPSDLRIRGRIVVAGHLASPVVLQGVLRDASQDRVTFLFDEATPESVICDYRETLVAELQSVNQKQVRVSLRTTEMTRQIGDALQDCDVLVWHATDISPLDLRTLLAQRQAFVDHLDRQGTLIAVGQAAELCGRYFYTEATANPTELEGLNLLADCVLETGYKARADDRLRLLSILAAYPRAVGIGLEDNTLLSLTGRRFSVLGEGHATFLLMANEREPVRSQTIAARRSNRQYESDYLVDLTQWRREAIDRTLPPFPPAEPEVPNVENGTLVIVGGGGTPEGLMTRFVELAGGVEVARMVYVPCSEDDEVSERQSTVEAWKRMGVNHATFVHTKDRHRANNDEAFLAPLRDATGLWFGGGRQWNFSDSYYGTKAHALMKAVLRRGGVVGGSSAGASIQARYLARATPIENFDIMAPGYERGGLGFIRGVAIDQHFSERKRQKDMTQLVNRYPQLLGIGIDERTAIIVHDSVAEVIGRGRVYFYDRQRPVYPDRPDYIALPDGSKFDLALRQVLVDTSTESEPATTTNR